MERRQNILKSLLLIVLLAVLQACASAPKEKPSAGLTGDDTVITSKVHDALFQEVTLRTSIIHVRTDQGVVRLTGMVEKAPYVYTARQIAGNVPGVVGVEEFLFVKDPGRTGGL